MKNLVILGIFFILLTGCASNAKLNQTMMEKNAIIVCRIDSETQTYHIDFRTLNINSTPKTFMANDVSIIKITPSKKIITFSMPAGSYYIENIIGENYNILTRTTIKSHYKIPLEMRRPINLVNGTILYIGSIKETKSETTYYFENNVIENEMKAEYPWVSNYRIESLSLH